jgi:hypothetical protein
VVDSGLPKRTFDRRFRAATGYSLLAYIQQMRIEEAKQMLETGDAPVDSVAREVGYEDARRSGVSPAWRRGTTAANSGCLPWAEGLRTVSDWTVGERMQAHTWHRPRPLMLDAWFIPPQ